MTMHPQPGLVARMLAALTRQRRLWQGMLFVLIALVCYLALAPSPPQAADLGWDKLNHAAAFAALATAGCWGYGCSGRAAALVLIGLLALGGLIELLQLFVPGRDSEWGDLLADAVGILSGAVLARMTRHLAQRSA